MRRVGSLITLTLLVGLLAPPSGSASHYWSPTDHPGCGRYAPGGQPGACSFTFVWPNPFTMWGSMAPMASPGYVGHVTASAWWEGAGVVGSVPTTVSCEWDGDDAPTCTYSVGGAVCSDTPPCSPTMKVQGTGFPSGSCEGFQECTGNWLMTKAKGLCNDIANNACGDDGTHWWKVCLWGNQQGSYAFPDSDAGDVLKCPEEPPVWQYGFDWN